MSVRTVDVDGSGEDGVFVWWDPGPLPVPGLIKALTAAGLGHLAPKSSTVPAALRETLSGFIEAAKVKVRGSPVTINPLREDVRGFEAVRQDRGDTENVHDFVISVVLDGNDHIRIAKHNPQYLPQVDTLKSRLEEKMQEQFQLQLDYYPTSMVSACFSRVIEALGGVLCRRAGGVYFLPGGALDKFTPLADALDPKGGTGFAITTTKFKLVPGERSYSLVIESLRKEISDALIEIEDGLKELGSKKQRSNGEATRMDKLLALRTKVTQYESLLGVTMTDLHGAVQKVQEAVSAHNALSVCV